MRFIGLDVHRNFCEVAISEGGKARPAGRIATRPDELELFAQSLGGDDRVVPEATGNALAIARTLEPHVAEVVLAHPRKLRAICEAKVKSDKLDARTLAELLAADLVPCVWVGDERTRLLRRLISRRRQLVKQRTATKNAISAVLMRNLKGRPPCSDLFGRAGRRWLAELELTVDERQTVDASLRQLDFLGEELVLVDRTIAERALASAEIRRLITIPASTSRQQPRSSPQSETSRASRIGAAWVEAEVADEVARRRGSTPARHGRTSKEGSTAARHVLVEAAWSAAKAPGPLRAFAERTAARRGHNIAAVAVARKLCVLAWHLLTREDYTFPAPLARPAQAAPARTPRRRAIPPGPARMGSAVGKPRPGRARARPDAPSRARLPAARHRLAAHKAEAGCGRDTGARIFSAV